MTDQDKVLREANKWGVRVLHQPFKRESGRHERFAGPVHGGIEWSTRTIYWPLPVNHEDGAHYLLHELVHCLMDKNPNQVDEMTTAMLSLEAEAARRLRLKGRKKWMADYSLGDGNNWDEISTQAQGKMLATSRNEAKLAGLMDKNGKPTYRRPT